MAAEEEGVFQGDENEFKQVMASQLYKYMKTNEL